MSCPQFEIAFWHPFGPHGNETPEHIIERKHREIDANSWTLWSFQYRQTLDAWHRQISSVRPRVVLAFCSEGRGAVDPAHEGARVRPIDCRSYCFVGQEEWRPMPEGVRVPHPFRPGRKLASAFVVQRVIHPVQPFELPAVEWFSTSKGLWCQGNVPTRGEFLIRPAGTNSMRPVRALLELKAPYLAFVSTDEA
jgi:hypothetical protein